MEFGGARVSQILTDRSTEQDAKTCRKKIRIKKNKKTLKKRIHFWHNIL
jgi:hypothetical protein